MSKQLPGITVITPTQGRDTLARLLDSIASNGLRRSDEHLVVIDTHGMGPDEADRITALVSGYGPYSRTIQHNAGGHDWGHAQVNIGIAGARLGNYITFHDDDDIVAPGAFDAIRAAIRSDAANGGPAPHLFKFVPPWRVPIIPYGRNVSCGSISGQCLVVPNLPDRVGRYASAYDGDYAMIRSTLDLWGGDEAAVFHEEVISIARPDA